MGKIKRLTFYSDKIRKDMKFLIVSDIHLTNEVGYENLRKISTLNEVENIDHIILPGDVVNDVNDLENKKFKEFLQNALFELSHRKPVFVSYGNHDQMTKSSSNEWTIGNRLLLKQTIKEIPNFYFVGNNQMIEKDGIEYAGFSPVFSYYEGKKEDKLDYQSNFSSNIDNVIFSNDKYSIFLTHEPQSIIKLSKEKGQCILPNTDLVVSGHMHNGLVPNFMQKFMKNKGFISPQMELFPEYAQGEVKVGDTNFIINGPVNVRVETPTINNMYGENATVLTLKRKM